VVNGDLETEVWKTRKERWKLENWKRETWKKRKTTRKKNENDKAETKKATATDQMQKSNYRGILRQGYIQP